jgi:hypothetical protein
MAKAVEPVISPKNSLWAILVIPFAPPTRGTPVALRRAEATGAVTTLFRGTRGFPFPRLR